MLSEEDNRLLHILSQDCRLTPEELSIQTGLGPDYIQNKIKQWEKEKVIVKYSPLINYEQLEENRVTALIDLKVMSQRDGGYDRIAQRFLKFPEIKSVYLMSGDYDLCLIVDGKNMHEIAQFVSDKLSPLDLIETTSTRFILRRYKQDGVEFLGEEERPQRLVITP